MKCQLLSTSLLLSLVLAAPIAEPSNNVQRADKQSCSSKPHPTLEDFHKAAKKWCDDHVRADAPNPPLLPKPVIDPHNKPIMPPLTADYAFKLPNPDKKKPDISLAVTFEIHGFAPIQRDDCYLGFGMQNGWDNGRKNDGKVQEEEQIEKGNVCTGPGGKTLVQGWDQSVGWNSYGVSFK
ncbi:hypothetical protein J4E83_004098 [Alternaria metachromatica]|uniref:uncharacterized protein n=1 Tax=Alternaria metachromatica TaxID=283354 RepID=UPI0020C53108|nr:uncharacterized protein J4E83_004098 [Alternaria metachromatica]KAI4624424.1 hypothetical protein J4E83_004098 [Alternaria metachromatica]